MQTTENKGYHDLEFLRGYVLKAKDHKYLATPPQNDYLIQRQRGQLEGMAESLYGLNVRSTANTSYGRTGTYDIASKLEIYNPATSFTVNYVPGRKRNSYHQEKDEYSV